MGGSGISWTICKSFAPGCRQITAAKPHTLVRYYYYYYYYYYYNRFTALCPELARVSQ